MTTKKEKKSMSKGKIILFVIIAIFAAITIYRIGFAVLGDKVEVVNETANVKVTEAAISNIELTSPITGRIQPVDEVNVVPKMPGVVKTVNVTLGQKVKKGELLFTLDGSSSYSSLAQAKAGQNQANLAYTSAKENYDRMASLFAEGAIAKQQLDQAKYQLDSALASISQANAGVSLAAEGASSARVTAPIAGYVTTVNVVAGGMASQAQPAVSIANIDTVEINATVSENLINKIKVGDKVQVYVKTVANTPFDGAITALSPAPAAGTLTYPIKVSISNGDIQIKPGMFAEVNVASETHRDVLTVPSNAVLIKGGKSVIAVIEGDVAIFKEVVTGIDNGQIIEIKSGLAKGDTIVFEGQSYLEDGDTVKVIQ